MAVAPTEIGRSINRGNNLALIPHVRVSNAVAHFAQTLPFRVRCSDDLALGLAWAERNEALRHRELAPDPPGWKTALRFDVDCPCDRQRHARLGYCPRAATYWRDALVAEPSFIVIAVPQPFPGVGRIVAVADGFQWIPKTTVTERLKVAKLNKINKDFDE